MRGLRELSNGIIVKENREGGRTVGYGRVSIVYTIRAKCDRMRESLKQDIIVYNTIYWSVYIVDEELSIEEIDNLSTQNPVAINEGSARVNGGQWIYVLCNINSKTTSEASNSTFRFYSFRDYA